MGYGEYGGGGSVAWRVDVDDETKPGKKRVEAAGRDAKTVTTFTMYLDYPNAGAATADLARLKGVGNGALEVQGTKIVFTVPVQQTNEKQIKIEWT